MSVRVALEKRKQLYLPLVLPRSSNATDGRVDQARNVVERGTYAHRTGSAGLAPLRRHEVVVEEEKTGRPALPEKFRKAGNDARDLGVLAAREEDEEVQAGLVGVAGA